MKSFDNLQRKTVGKCEIIVILILLFVTIFLYIFLLQGGSDENAVAQIFFDGEFYAEIPLDENGEFPLEKLELTLTVLNGKIAITENNCVGQDCVKAGFIGSSREVIVCLPKKIVVKIFDKENVDYDVILQ